MTKQNSLGVVENIKSNERRIDYLFRISLKAIIRNDKNEILMVKEAGRGYWDLPGGGMDHNEDIKTTLFRELQEEINLTGDFTFKIIDAGDPTYSESLDIWLMRLLYEVKPDNMKFSAGEDGDEVGFINPNTLKDSAHELEQFLYNYLEKNKLL